MSDIDWKGLASALSAKGRGGDTELVHVNPREKMLLALFGGSGDKNPKTGLTEYDDGSGGSGGFGGNVDPGQGAEGSPGGLASQGALGAIGAAGADIGGRMAGSIAGPVGMDITGDFGGMQGMGGNSLSGRSQGPSTMDALKAALSLVTGFNPVTSMVGGGVPGLIAKDMMAPGTQPSSWDVMSAVMGPMAVGAYGLNSLASALGLENRGIGAPGSDSSGGQGDMNYVDLLRQMQQGSTAGG